MNDAMIQAALNKMEEDQHKLLRIVGELQAGIQVLTRRVEALEQKTRG